MVEEIKEVRTPKDIEDLVDGQKIDLFRFTLGGGGSLLLNGVVSYVDFDSQRNILFVSNKGEFQEYGFNPVEKAFDIHYKQK